jgi:HK97 family phage portal protein
MKIPFTKKEIKLQSTKQSSTPRINADNFNKLYDILLQYLGKGQLIWNKNNLKYLIESGYLFNPDTYSIINKIIQTASMCQLKLYEIKDEKSFRQYKNVKSFSPDNMLDFQRKAFEPVEQPEIFKLLEQPNKYNTYTLFIQNLLGYYCLLGNSYLNKIVVNGNKNGVAGELQVLPAYLVKIIAGTPANPIAGYTIENWNKYKYNYTQEEIYHYRTFNPNYDIGQFMYGAPPSIYPTLLKSNDSYEAACSLIQNLGAMGILSSGNDDTIDTETSEKMEQKYKDKFGGAKNRGKIWIVGHKMEWVNMAESITDLNLIQGQEQDFLTLCRIFNVDSRIMGYVKGSTFSNMEEARKDFIQNRIMPLMYMVTESFNKFIIPAFSAQDNKNYYLDVDTNIIPELQQDNDKVSLRLQSEIKRGMITPADAAKQLGYPELTDELAKQLWVGTDVIPMNKLNEPKQNFKPSI